MVGLLLTLSQAQPKRYNVSEVEDEKYRQHLRLRAETIVNAASRLWGKYAAPSACVQALTLSRTTASN